MVIGRRFGDYSRMLRKGVGGIQDNFVGGVVVMVGGNPFGLFRLIFVMVAAFFNTFRVETECIAVMMMRKHDTAHQQHQCKSNTQTGNLLFHHFTT